MSLKQPKNFSWVDPGKLAAFGCPSSPENLRFLLENKITYIVTLSPETVPRVSSFPDLHWFEINVPEFHPPENFQIKKFLSICDEAINLGQAAGVHCRMGRGRTGVMAACYLVKFHDMTPQSAMGEVRKNRPGSIETFSQEECVMDYYFSICKERQSELSVAGMQIEENEDVEEDKHAQRNKYFPTSFGSICPPQ